MKEKVVIDDFIKQVGNTLGETASQLSKLPSKEIQAQVQQLAKSTLDKMDLVSREDFEIQAAMLAKYRDRVIELEERMKKLEEQLQDK
jgi:BMFP domain-containing protein YqiC